MDDQQRRIFLSVREVYEAGNPPVIGIRVELQTVTLVVAEELNEQEIPLQTETQVTYVELDAAELETLRNMGQRAIDEFGMRLGPLVAGRLGGTVKRWREAPHAGMN